MNFCLIFLCHLCGVLFCFLSCILYSLLVPYSDCLPRPDKSHVVFANLPLSLSVCFVDVFVLFVTWFLVFFAICLLFSMFLVWPSPACESFLLTKHCVKFLNFYVSPMLSTPGSNVIIPSIFSTKASTLSSINIGLWALLKSRWPQWKKGRNLFICKVWKKGTITKFIHLRKTCLYIYKCVGLCKLWCTGFCSSYSRPITSWGTRNCFATLPL